MIYNMPIGAAVKNILLASTIFVQRFPEMNNILKQNKLTKMKDRLERVGNVVWKT